MNSANIGDFLENRSETTFAEIPRSADDEQCWFCSFPSLLGNNVSMFPHSWDVWPNYLAVHPSSSYTCAMLATSGLTL